MAFVIKRNRLRIDILKQQGFTLVELIVTLSIVALVAAIAAPAFNSQIAGYQLRSHVNDVASSLNEKRAEAVTKRSQSAAYTIAGNTEITMTRSPGSAITNVVFNEKGVAGSATGSVFTPITANQIYTFSNSNTSKTYKVVLSRFGKVNVI